MGWTQSHRLTGQVREHAWKLCAAALLGVLALPSASEEPGQAGEPWPADPAAARLLAKTLANLYAGDFVQVLELTSRNRAGRAMTRRLQAVRKESTPPGRAVVRFLSPPEVRGTAMLVIEQAGRSDDVFLYLPAFGHTRRISSAQRYDSFFGTNLTYEDLEPKRANDFEAVLEGRSEVEGVSCLLLRIRARPGIASQYDFTRSCVDPERAVALWTEYTVAGRVVKRMTADPRRVKRHAGHFIPELAQLTSTATEFVTEITTESHQPQREIPDRLFTTWNLESGSGAGDLKLLRAAGAPR